LRRAAPCDGFFWRDDCAVPNFQTGGKLTDFLLERGEHAIEALKAIPEQEFLADPDGCVEWIYSECGFDTLSVSGVDGVESEGTKSTKLTAYDRWEKLPYQYDGLQTVIRIPFTGASQLWRYQPSTHFASPAAYSAIDELRDDHFVFVMGGPNLVGARVRSALEKSIKALQKTAGWINSDVEPWLIRMRVNLETVARERQNLARRANALDAVLGIPIAPTAPEKAIPIPVKRIPLKRQTPVAGPSMTREWVLQDDVYQDVLRTIEQMGRAMERTPTAAKLKEEELRNLILIVLNANYEGAVHGEAFNGVGKTDLLLTWQGENAFIGECKIWTGPAKFRDAIDQLLGYVTWRDTKAALVVFIKKGAPSAIIAKAHAEIQDHSSCVRLKDAVNETRLDYLLQSPSDPDRHIDLALVAVVIPESADRRPNP
jgi:hypothetical protein